MGISGWGDGVSGSVVGTAVAMLEEGDGLEEDMLSEIRSRLERLRSLGGGFAAVEVGEMVGAGA